MRVLIASDSFKESCNAKDVCQSIARGLRRLPFSFEIDECPMADGGEGMLAAIASALEVHIERVTVSDPLGNRCEAELGWVQAEAWPDVIETIDHGTNVERIALLEAATCIGLAKVPQPRRDPLITSSYGLGQLLMHAMRKGATTIVIGLGGTSTVDGGLGLAQAMGVEFEGIPECAGGAAMARVTSIDPTALQAFKARIILASDVSNPLLGPRGAARAFGPQKGAAPPVVEQLESSMGHYARCLYDACASMRGVDAPLTNLPFAPHAATTRADTISGFESAVARPGTGAAGGLGFALQQLFGAVNRSGVELTMGAVGFDERLRRSDMVITGEGRLDRSSFEGKVVSGVLSRARAQGVPTYAVVGSNAYDDREALRARGLIHVETLVEHASDLADAIARAGEILADCGARLGRLALPSPT
ncbi:MAG TPA: glycerate kinase [Polyangiaceae bacterium]